MTPKAKYGDESVYFDLNDPEATTGSWDVYGQESTARYPGQQEEFFEKAAQGLGRREAMYSFLALAGPAACLIFGGKGAKDANLPITVGPQQTPPSAPATASERESEDFSLKTARAVTRRDETRAKRKDEDVRAKTISRYRRTVVISTRRDT